MFITSDIISIQLMSSDSETIFDQIERYHGY